MITFPLVFGVKATRTRWVATVAIGCGFALVPAGCAKDEGVAAGARGLSIVVSPLQLVGVVEASYGITVTGTAGPVWTKSGIKSTEYGDGKGAITYVGTCDAQSNPHTVALVLESLQGLSGPITEFQNPATASQPLQITGVTCVENGDTPVEFNLTIMREANQGFFDIGVTFSDIFCSAKIDCLPTPLLHVPGGERGPTAVMAFACTSGKDLQGNAEDTFLHLTNITVECGVLPDVTTYTVLPDGPVGNMGGVGLAFFQTANYRGEETLPGFDKCYWNVAFGVNDVAAAGNCKIIAQGTASDSSWTADGGNSPDNTVYPFVDFSVTLTDGEGNLACGSHPLNGTNSLGGPSGVKTAYTGVGGATFTHQWQCGTETITTEKVSCSGLVAGQTTATAASFVQTPGGVQVAFGNSWSPLYELPSEYEVDDCCMNPCCTVPGTTGD